MYNNLCGGMLSDMPALASDLVNNINITFHVAVPFELIPYV